MPISVLVADVRERCGLDGTDFDDEIAALIGQLATPIEFAIRPEFLADTTPGLVATLNLAALEIVAGEFFCQLSRKPGYFDAVTIFGLEVAPFVRGPAADLTGLKAQGWARLSPYLKSEPGGSPLGQVLAAGGKASLEDPL